MVRRLNKKRSEKIGLPPGSMIHVGEKKVEKTSFSVIDYDAQSFEMHELETIEEAFPYLDTPMATWLDINGLHEIEPLQKIGRYYHIHPLLLEDILDTDHRPKADIAEDYIFIILKNLDYSERDGLKVEQVSLFLGKNFLITFQERESDLFAPIRERLKNSNGLLRKTGADYLTYALVDILVDRYFLVIEKMDEMMEYLEDTVLSNPGPTLVHDIQKLKRDLIYIRKFIWPLREFIGNLMREESDLVQKQTRPYLRDLYDHTIHIIDSLENYRDMLSGILDVYLSSISNRLNEVMKMLTIIATIFIPLTFIVGVYGMNFEHMPEIKWLWGYPVIWGLMLLIALAMLAFFRKKKWL